MARSYKKAIFKDKGLKSIYWRTIRRVTNQRVKLFLTHPVEEVVLPHPRSLINDYTYSDYTIDYHHVRPISDSFNNWAVRLKRK